MRDLFAAVFVIGFGLTADVHEVVPMLPVALALAVVSASTKVATGSCAAGRDGAAFKGRLRAGTALIARGEFSIVIAGLAAGYDSVKPLATAHVLVLAVSGPVLARYSDAIADRVRPPARTAPGLPDPSSRVGHKQVGRRRQRGSGAGDVRDTLPHRRPTGIE